jgi:hypothetical protein
MNRHLTEDEICRAIAGQSTLDEQRHLRTCATCSADLSHWRQALALFRHDARERAERTTPPIGVRTARALPGSEGPAFEVIARQPERRFPQPVWGIAATLLVASAALVWQVRPTSGPLPPQELPRRVIDATNDFFPLAYSTVPITHARLVRIEVPRTAPALFGIDPAGLVNAPHNTVVADVVVGEDGLARAVRFVRLQTSVTKE